MQQLVEGEELQIIALLEEFVDEQVDNRIAAAREKVLGGVGSRQRPSRRRPKCARSTPMSAQS